MTEQRTEEWFASRSGKITGSRFADVLGTPAARAKYMRQLAFERLSGSHLHEVSSRATTWGTEVEAFAREAYEIRTGLIVVQAPFILHAKHDFIGCSPDGLVGSDGGIEMKCPHDEAVHIETWLSGMPDGHRPQVQGLMLVTGRSWVDFISYDPRQSERMRLYVQRVKRDDAYIAKLSAAIVAFEHECREMVAELEKAAAAA